MAKAKAPMAHIESTPEPVADERKETPSAAQAKQPDPAPASAPTSKEPARKAARPKMQVADEPRPEPTKAPEPESAGKSVDMGATSLADTAHAQVKLLLTEHFHAVVGGVCGLVVAILIFVVGFWQTLFVSALAAVGVAVGQYLDGDPKIVNLIRRLLSEGRGNN